MMSAYLSRLVQRFSPPASDDGSGALRPFIRSRSPVAAIDQRLGVDESLGHGLGDLAGGGFDEPMSDSPEPMQVQRKAASASVTAPTLAAPAPTSTAPAADASPVSPTHAPVPVPAAATSASARVDAEPPAAELSPRREPMDPGQLFAPFPLHHADLATDESTLAPTKVEMRTIERIIEGGESSSPSSRSTTAVFAPVPGSTTGSTTRSAPRPTSAALLAAPRLSVANAPWVAFDRSTPAPGLAPTVPAPGLAPTADAPVLEPRRAGPSQLELRVVPLVVEPRQPTPSPFVPDAAPSQAVAQSTSVQSPPAHERVNPAPKPASNPRAPSTPLPAHGKLDIESISQIGPLAPHFPNRRRFRLRFR